MTFYKVFIRVRYDVYTLGFFTRKKKITKTNQLEEGVFEYIYANSPSEAGTIYENMYPQWRNATLTEGAKHKLNIKYYDIVERNIVIDKHFNIKIDEVLSRLNVSQFIDYIRNHQFKMEVNKDE